MLTQYKILEPIMEIDKRSFEKIPSLVERAQGGDETAFIQLCQENAGHIYAVCLRMLAHPDRAKELAQEAAIRAWQMLDSFRGESAFAGWIHRIAVNAVLDHLRSEKRLSARVHFTDDIELYDCEGQSVSPEDSIDLESAIASLPLQTRTVIVLHDIEGYTHEEIASMLGIAPGTSKAQLHRARMLLKERLTL